MGLSTSINNFKFLKKEISLKGDVAHGLALAKMPQFYSLVTMTKAEKTQLWIFKIKQKGVLMDSLLLLISQLH